MEYVSLKPPLILADSGFFRQGNSSYTFYYSLTRNDVSGTLNIDDIVETVAGFSWIDRQYGTFNPLTSENYEWFSLQLSNGMDINLWNIFNFFREIPDSPAYRIMSVSKDEYNQFTTNKFEIERLSFQYMPDSARCYARKWRLTTPDSNYDLIFSTRHSTSEVQLPFRFFEGSITVNGSVNGIEVSGTGFAELLHSYRKPDIFITYPDGPFWNSNRPLSWHLVNPDDGRPLKYNLECSIDNKRTFSTIVEGLPDTLYYWENPFVSTGDSCWFKVTAYSKDTTLHHSVISSLPSVFDPDFTSIPAPGNEVFDIKVYPNPTDNNLLIDVKPGHPYKLLLITDISGNIFFEQSIGRQDHFVINLPNAIQGLYFVRFVSDKGTVCSKFIIR
jgi:hypothetical protein